MQLCLRVACACVTVALARPPPGCGFFLRAAIACARSICSPYGYCDVITHGPYDHTQQDR
ncbi:unnamed protein product [Musa textilis]